MNSILDVKTPTELREFMSEPTDGLVEMMAKLDGDIMVIGGDGKVGPELVQTLVKADQKAGTTGRKIMVSGLFITDYAKHAREHVARAERNDAHGYAGLADAADDSVDGAVASRDQHAFVAAPGRGPHRPRPHCEELSLGKLPAGILRAEAGPRRMIGANQHGRPRPHALDRRAENYLTKPCEAAFRQSTPGPQPPLRDPHQRPSPRPLPRHRQATLRVRRDGRRGGPQRGLAKKRQGGGVLDRIQHNLIQSFF